MGSPVFEDDSSIDYLLGNPPTGTEGYFVSDDADDINSNSPSTASKIPSPSQPSSPNTSQ